MAISSDNRTTCNLTNTIYMVAISAMSRDYQKLVFFLITSYLDNRYAKVGALSND